MALDNAEFFVPGDGALNVGVVGAPAPSSASSDISTNYQHLGFATEDGANVAPSQTMTETRSWQSFYVTRRTVATKDLVIGIGLQQWNADTVSLYFGGATVSGSAGVYTITPPAASLIDTRSFILDGIDGVKRYRLYIPQGMVTEQAAAVWSRGAAAVLGVTISVVATGSSDPWKLFVADGQFPAYPAGNYPA